MSFSQKVFFLESFVKSVDKTSRWTLIENGWKLSCAMNASWILIKESIFASDGLKFDYSQGTTVMFSAFLWICCYSIRFISLLFDDENLYKSKQVSRRWKFPTGAKKNFREAMFAFIRSNPWNVELVLDSHIICWAPTLSQHSDSLTNCMISIPSQPTLMILRILSLALFKISTFDQCRRNTSWFHER